MESKIVTIQTNTKKKGKLDQRSLSCQILELGKRRMYALENTKRDLGLKRFTLTEGCRVIDDGVYYPIHQIFYTPNPQHPILIVYPDSVTKS